MATKRGFSGWRAVSKVEEASYDAGAAIAATYRHAADPIQLEVELEDGTTLVGVQAEEADEQEIISRRSTGAEELPRLRPNEAALFLSFLLGNLNQSPVDEPAAGYRTHTITPFPRTFATGAQDGSSVPLSALNVEDTSSWPSAGTLVNEATGNPATYSGKTATTFTGLAGAATSDTWADNQALHLEQPDYDYTLPSFSVLDSIGGTQKQQWDGMMVQQLEISGDRKGFIRAGARLLGSGSVSAPATAQPAPVAEVYLKMGDAQVNIGGTFDGRSFSGGTSLNAQVRSFRWEGVNEIPDELIYLPGQVDKPARAERLRRRQSLQAALEFADQTEHNWVVSQNNLNLQINLVGAVGAYAVRMIFPQFRFNVAPVSGGTGVLVRTLEAGVQQHSNYGSFFAQVVNQQVGYLH